LLGLVPDQVYVVLRTNIEQYFSKIKEKVKLFLALQTERRFRVALIYPGL
jgi:hypothetical protein